MNNQKSKLEKDFEAGLDSITNAIENLTEHQIALLKRNLKFEKEDKTKVKNINKNIKGG